MRRFLAALCLTLPLLPGCVAYEIRDELRTTNFRLSSLETQLEELQRTNQRLEVVRQQLRILEQVQVSLSNLDDHLSAVRVIISSMNSMISLFDFSSKDETAPDGTDPAQPGAQDPLDPLAPADPDAPDQPEQADPAAPIEPAPSQATPPPEP